MGLTEILGSKRGGNVADLQAPCFELYILQVVLMRYDQ